MRKTRALLIGGPSRDPFAGRATSRDAFLGLLKGGVCPRPQVALDSPAAPAAVAPTRYFLEQRKRKQPDRSRSPFLPVRSDATCYYYALSVLTPR